MLKQTEHTFKKKKNFFLLLIAHVNIACLIGSRFRCIKLDWIQFKPQIQAFNCMKNTNRPGNSEKPHLNVSKPHLTDSNHLFCPTDSSKPKDIQLTTNKTKKTSKYSNFNWNQWILWHCCFNIDVKIVDQLITSVPMCSGGFWGCTRLQLKPLKAQKLKVDRPKRKTQWEIRKLK